LRASPSSVGLDVSVKETAICIVAETGKVMRETIVASESAAILAVLTAAGLEYARVGLEAGPLSQWLVNGFAEAGLPVVCVETRHMKAVLKAQQVNKSDRHDARGMAQMMRVGLYKPVHVKALASQEKRMLLTSRKLLRHKRQDVESDLRGTLRNFGLKVGAVSQGIAAGAVRDAAQDGARPGAQRPAVPQPDDGAGGGTSGGAGVSGHGRPAAATSPLQGSGAHFGLTPLRFSRAK
jgi:transposase